MQNECWAKTNTRALRRASVAGQLPPSLQRHLLRHHALDAASVMAAILVVPAVRHFLEQLLESALRPADVERFCALAFLHDFAKLDPDFQALDRLLSNGKLAPLPNPCPRHDLIGALMLAELARPTAALVPSAVIFQRIAYWFPPREDGAGGPVVVLPPNMRCLGATKPFDLGPLEVIAWHHGRFAARRPGFGAAAGVPRAQLARAEPAGR